MNYAYALQWMRHKIQNETDLAYVGHQDTHSRSV